jgi:hypothetical protein
MLACTHMVVHVATLGNSVFARACIFFLVTRCKKFPSRISHIPIKRGHTCRIGRNVHNDAMTNVITCWKNDAMVKGLDLYCEVGRFKSSYIQPTWMWLVSLA